MKYCEFYIQTHVIIYIALSLWHYNEKFAELMESWSLNQNFHNVSHHLFCGDFVRSTESVSLVLFCKSSTHRSSGYSNVNNSFLLSSDVDNRLNLNIRNIIKYKLSPTFIDSWLATVCRTRYWWSDCTRLHETRSPTNKQSHSTNCKLRNTPGTMKVKCFRNFVSENNRFGGPARYIPCCSSPPLLIEALPRFTYHEADSNKQKVY